MQNILSSPELILLIGFIYFFAGFVKGVIGFGLPNLAIGTLTLIFGIYPAILLTLFPMLVSNFLQAFDGPYFKTIFNRLWSFLIPAWIMTYLSSQLLKNPGFAELFSLVLGVLLSTYAVLILLKKEIRIPPERESFLSPVIGTINGIITGFTGTVMVPSAFYLKGLGFQKDVLVQAMGIVFGSSTLILIFSLGKHDMMQQKEAVYSLLAVIPTMAGMFAGRRLRAKISNETFLKLFLYGLIGIGTLIIIRTAVNYI